MVTRISSKINRNIQSSLTLNETAYDTFLIIPDVARPNRAVPAKVAN